jgi:hypothetical protein
VIDCYPEFFLNRTFLFPPDGEIEEGEKDFSLRLPPGEND